MTPLKRIGTFTTIMLVVSMVGQPVFADEASKQKLFDELYEVMNYDRIIDRMSDGVDSQISTALRRKYPDIDDRALKTVTEVLHEEFEALVPLMKEFTRSFMTEHFSEEDIRNIMAFYRTPTGQKSLVVLPKMTTEMTQWMMPVIQRMRSGLIRRLNERLKDQGYDL